MAKIIGSGLFRSGAVAAEDKWLSGGIDPSNVVAAYEPLGAASLAASLINKNDPGTNDAISVGSDPSHSLLTGWYFNQTGYLQFPVSLPSDQTWSVFARFTGLTSTKAVDYIFGMYNTTGGNASFAIGGSINAGTLRIYYSGAFNSYAFTSPVVSNCSMAIAGKSCYLDGALDLTIAGGVGSGSFTGYIGVPGYNGVPRTDLGMFGYMQYLYVYNTQITAPQVAALHVATA